MNPSVENKSTVSKIVVRFLVLLKKSWSVFREADGPMNAAAMAHFALLSLVPFMIFAAGVMNLFLASDTGITTADGTGTAGSYDAVARPVRHLLPFVDEGLSAQVRGLVRDYRSTGFVSFFVLLLTAGLFFNALETSVKRVFSVQSRRAWVAKTRVIGFVLSILVLLAVGSYAWRGLDLAVSSGFRSLVTALIVATGFSLVIFWFASFRTRPLFVAAGALLMCLLWTIAHVAFQYYLENIGNLSDVFGALTGLAILMVWIYYAALIFLFSCSFVQALNLSEQSEMTTNTLE